VLRTLLGDTAFKAGLDLYFERCDGTAATVEDFLGCFEEATGASLDAFKVWYGQAGTPHVKATSHYDAAAQSWALTLTQDTPPTPGQPIKHAVSIPVRMGLLGSDGNALPLVIDGEASGTEAILKLTEKSQTWVFTGLSEAPTPSLLRGFSAPVVLDAALDERALALLAAHDTDSFVRWEALQSIARRVLLTAGTTPRLPSLDALIAALGSALDQSAADPAFAALLLRLPDLPELIQISTDANPDALKAGRDRVRAALALALHDKLEMVLDRYDHGKAFSPDAASAGTRALNAAALDLLVSLETSAVVARASSFFAKANCLTDTMAALEALGGVGGAAFDEALIAFYEVAKDRPLVLDKWFSVQAASAAGDPLARMQTLRAHPAFDLKNPNRVRSLAASFSMRNPVGLHRADGAGYAFMADLAIAIDRGNPALSARLLGTLESWRKVELSRRQRAEAVLRGVAGEPELSANSREIVERMLG
jgi:aminopeptidase N